MGTIYLIGYKKNVDTDSIIWLEGHNNYTKVYLQQGEVCLISQPLKWFERHLPDFLRINRSSLVNPGHIRGFDQTDSRHAKVLLCTGLELAVSRRRIKLMVAKLQAADQVVVV